MTPPPTVSPEQKRMLALACEFALACPQIEAVAELGEALARSVAQLGFTAVASGRLQPTGEIVTLHFANWPDFWRELYEKRGFMRVDPVPIWAANAGTPVTVAELVATLPRHHPGREVMRAARSHGYAGGLVAPQRSSDNHPGVVAIIGPRDPLDPVLRFALTGMASLAFHRAEALLGRQPPASLAPYPFLTARESECLRHLIEGRTTAAIAEAMGVSEPTVRFHARNLREKTGAANRAQLTAIAIARGLAQPG